MKKKSKIVLTAVCSAVGAVIAFSAGLLTATMSKNQASRSINWIIDTINQNYYKDVDNDELVAAAMSGGFSKLLDVYSTYYTKEEYRQVVNSNSGQKSGIGISYSFVSGKGVLINSVLGNSPAHEAGLKRGMYLDYGINSNNEEILFSSANSFADFVSGFVDGEQMTLHATDEDGNAIDDFKLGKAEYKASYAYMFTKDCEYAVTYDGGKTAALVKKTDETMNYLPDGAAYINLMQFYGSAVSEMSMLINKFNELNCTSLILDLRGNGGGYVSVMQGISYQFTANHPNEYNNVAMYAEYKNGKRENYYIALPSDKSATIASDVDVYVIANADTASASEALIGVLISYGVIDYEDIYLSDYSDEYVNWLESGGYTAKDGQTYGKGIMQTTFTNITTGEALKLTTAEIYWPNGVSIHDVGISAYSKEYTCNLVPAQWSVTYSDEELQTAVEMMYDVN